MSPLQAIVLALVQAVTEFLPISSSGHLILIPHLLGWPDQGLSFDILANTGTLLAVAVYFRRDLLEIVRSALTAPRIWRSEAPPAARLGWYLALGTLPAVVVGLAIHRWVEGAGRRPLLVAVNLIAYGLLLLWADRRARQERTEADLTWKTALLVGAAQALALVPGTSRSGITLTALLLLGFTRPAAASSFLLAVPVGIGGGEDLAPARIAWRSAAGWRRSRSGLGYLASRPACAALARAVRPLPRRLRPRTAGFALRG